MSNNIIRDEHGNPFIVVKQHIAPDFSVTDKVKSYSDKYDYYMLHFSIEEKIAVAEECDEEYKPKGYGDMTYISFRVYQGRVWILDRRKGWIPHAKATERYAEILAEKELLGED